jgi:G patch domain/KOW motif-containing protein
MSTLRTSQKTQETEEVDDITSIGRSGIVGSKVTKKKRQIVIPLIQDEFGHSEASNAAPPASSGSSGQGAASGSEPILEGAKEPRKDAYEGMFGLIAPSASHAGRPNQSKAPMLARSRPKGWRDIEDEDERLKYELSVRPETDVSAYERVPIEDFGKAMLLGMGWKPGVNDGAKVLELPRRPERLGLGAVPKQPPPDPKKPLTPGQRQDGPSPSKNGFNGPSPFLDDGTRVVIVSGPHDGMTGRIRRLSSDQKEYIVELENDEQVRVRLKEVENFDSKKRPASGTHRDPAPNAKRYMSAEIVSEPKAPQPKEESSNKTQKLWVTPFIRVKVQSKKFRDGKYYCKKGVVEDIISGTRCAIRLDEGQVIDDIDQADLETVIPPVGGRIMVVRGPDTGIRGTLREKDSQKEVVYIQIEDELDVLKFSMDDVAEYVE